MYHHIFFSNQKALLLTKSVKYGGTYLFMIVFAIKEWNFLSYSPLIGCFLHTHIVLHKINKVIINMRKIVFFSWKLCRPVSPLNCSIKLDRPICCWTHTIFYTRWGPHCSRPTHWVVIYSACSLKQVREYTCPPPSEILSVFALTPYLTWGPESKIYRTQAENANHATTVVGWAWHW